MIKKLMSLFGGSKNAADPIATGTKLCNAGKHSKAVEILRPVAESGNAEAQYWMGVTLNRACATFDPDFADVPDDEDIKWFEMAAKQGHTKACVNLGAILFSRDKARSLAEHNGVGEIKWLCSQDSVQAFEWYHIAALAGEITAIMHVGSAYWTGRGVGKNVEEARRWLQKAAQLGSEDAKRGLEQLEREGNGQV